MMKELTMEGQLILIELSCERCALLGLVGSFRSAHALTGCALLILQSAFCDTCNSSLPTPRFYLKASPLPPAPLAVAGFMVAGLVAWQYSSWLAGLLGFAVWFLFCWYSPF